ncbi:uncharacterized protein LOC123883367 [Trifolium pratense]|uniref:uncharacterized protein LOC123883367 n=1 Tax=Trifolium pratense TaxID=57577 RepID=UPI001E696B5B|nr:uncharacterized protein LOC123883367 [Trifolium pratense]
MEDPNNGQYASPPDGGQLRAVKSNGITKGVNTYHTRVNNILKYSSVQTTTSSPINLGPSSTQVTYHETTYDPSSATAIILESENPSYGAAITLEVEGQDINVVKEPHTTFGTEKSRGFVNIVEDGDDVASSFDVILKLLDPTPSYVFDGSSSSTIETTPDNHGVVNLFREIKEIFSNSTNVSSFDQTTTIRVHYLVEKLRPLRLQLHGANQEAFIAFEKFFTSLEANTTLLAVIPTHDHVTTSMNEIRREALASKTAAETLVETRDQKRHDISNRSNKIDLLEHQLAELKQAQIDDTNEINRISSKLAQGMEVSKAVFTRVVSVKETLAALSFSYNRAIAVHQELETLLTEAVRHASI